MQTYYQVWCSAETHKQAKEILDHLTHQHLVVGGTILNGPTHFWWKGAEIDMDYYYIMGFTTIKRKGELEKEYEKISSEEIPMISFIQMEGNAAFLDFISSNT